MSFNPIKPYNDLPLLPPDFNFDDVEILKKVNKANIALTRLSGEAKSIPNREVLIEPLTFREAVASSEIENIHTTVEEAFQATYFVEKELKKEQKETKYYREALLTGYNEIKQHGFLNTNSFIGIQSHIVPEKAELSCDRMSQGISKALRKRLFAISDNTPVCVAAGTALTDFPIDHEEAIGTH